MEPESISTKFGRVDKLRNEIEAARASERVQRAAYEQATKELGDAQLRTRNLLTKMVAELAELHEAIDTTYAPEELNLRAGPPVGGPPVNPASHPQWREDFGVGGVPNGPHFAPLGGEHV